MHPREVMMRPDRVAVMCGHAQRILTNQTRFPKEAVRFSDLVELIWPIADCDTLGRDMQLRRQLFNVLRDEAGGLMRGYCHKGEETSRKFMGRTIHPLVWHAYDDEHFKNPVAKTAPTATPKAEIAELLARLDRIEAILRGMGQMS